MALKGLIIRKPWIGMIVAGTKTWEMRSDKTSVKGAIVLIEQGTGLVVGTSILSDSLPPLGPKEMATAQSRHCIPSERSGSENFKWFTPWVLSAVHRLEAPVPYDHRSGAVIWVELAAVVECAIRLQSPFAHLEPTAATVASGDRSFPSNVPNPNNAVSSSGVHIPLTGGNTRNNHFYLRLARHLLHVDAIGGTNKGTASWPVTVNFSSGETAETDVDGEKMIFRDRASVRRSFEQVKPSEGDQILLERTADRRFRVSLAA